MISSTRTSCAHWGSLALVEGAVYPILPSLVHILLVFADILSSLSRIFPPLSLLEFWFDNHGTPLLLWAARFGVALVQGENVAAIVEVE